MWANAQRDGRPAEYRWRPLFNATKFGWCPLLECRAVTLPRGETRWNLQGCPKLRNRSQSLLGGSSPYYEDMWRRYCCLIIFCPIVDNALVAKIQPNELVQGCPDGESLAIFCILHFQWATRSTFQTCTLNSHYGHTMCGSMLDVQSATAEIRRGKKKKKNKLQDKNIMSASVLQGGRPLLKLKLFAWPKYHGLPPLSPFCEH